MMSAKFSDFLTPSPHVCFFTQPPLLSFLTASAFEVPPSPLPMQTSYVHDPLPCHLAFYFPLCCREVWSKKIDWGGFTERDHTYLARGTNRILRPQVCINYCLMIMGRNIDTRPVGPGIPHPIASNCFFGRAIPPKSSQQINEEFLIIHQNQKIVTNILNIHNLLTLMDFSHFWRKDVYRWSYPSSMRGHRSLQKAEVQLSLVLMLR